MRRLRWQSGRLEIEEVGMGDPRDPKKEDERKKKKEDDEDEENGEEAETEA
jgi:hypothetical protein